MEDYQVEIFRKLEHMEHQINRLVSDAESEKAVRRDRNTEIDRRLKELEIDKIIRDTTINNAVLAFKILCGLNLSALIAFIIMIIKYLNK